MLLELIFVRNGSLQVIASELAVFWEQCAVFNLSFVHRVIDFFYFFIFTVLYFVYDFVIIILLGSVLHMIAIPTLLFHMLWWQLVEDSVGAIWLDQMQLYQLIVAFTYHRRDIIELAIEFTKQIFQICQTWFTIKINTEVLLSYIILYCWPLLATSISFISLLSCQNLT